MEALFAHHRLGSFNLQGVEGHSDLGAFKPGDFNGFARPFPVFWALTCLVQNKLRKQLLKPKPSAVSPAASGHKDYAAAKISQLTYQVYELRPDIPKHAMSPFISERVDDLCTELDRRRRRLAQEMAADDLEANDEASTHDIYAARPDRHTQKVNFEIFQERYNATLHHLLCASAALKDPDLTRKICRAFDDSAPSSLKHGGGSSLVQEYPLFNPLDREQKGATEYTSAPFVAMMFEAVDVIDVMLQEGWSPFGSLIKWEAGDVSLVDPLRNLSLGKSHFLSDMPAGDDLISFSPLMARKCMGMLKVDGGYVDQTADKLHKWAIECFETPENDLDAIYLALEMGVYDIKPNESYAAAAERGIIEVIDQLGARLDWSLFTPKQNPILQNLNSGLWNEHSDEMATVCMTIFEQTVAGGRPDLVRERNLRGGGFGDFIETPLLRCVENRFDEGVVFCLEQGADPDASVGYIGSGKSVLETADQSGNVETATLIRSFQVRKAAREAIGSIGCSGLKP